MTDSDEPVLSFTLPADGSYKLAVEELAGRGGGDYGYAVECESGPQFSLALKNDKNNRLRQSLPVAAGRFTWTCSASGLAMTGRSRWRLIRRGQAGRCSAT